MLTVVLLYLSGAWLSGKMGVRSGFGLSAIQYFISSFLSHVSPQTEFTADSLNLALNTKLLIFNGRFYSTYQCSVSASQIIMILFLLFS